jgi:hypothetical protein
MDTMRASDAEREECVAALREAAEEGRLDIDELDERMGRAYAAKTRGELAELLADIPRPAPPPMIPPPQYPVAPLHIRTNFQARWTTPGPPDRAVHEFLTQGAPTLYRSGYHLSSRWPNRLLFARQRHPAWTFVLAVLFFPIGLLALLVTDYEQIAVDIEPAGDHTVLTARGVAPGKLRRWFGQLGR